MVSKYTKHELKLLGGITQRQAQGMERKLEEALYRDVRRLKRKQRLQKKFPMGVLSR